MSNYTTQNNLLLDNLIKFYNINDNLHKMLKIINGQSSISLRIVDWFATNYAKQKFTTYNLKNGNRFKVYNDYKLKLRSYSKKRFDPFCRWERITIPYDDTTSVQTTIGQLNFFKWAIENEVIDFIQDNYKTIENDMNNRNSTSKRKISKTNNLQQKTRKKREELSISASKSIKQEKVSITIKFD
jgi:hypothetical protein|tara:strand:+ start:2026 stop:2580 length:555 start_codon:yes stop_codon:yes gene_type:complete